MRPPRCDDARALELLQAAHARKARRPNQSHHATDSRELKSVMQLLLRAEFERLAEWEKMHLVSYTHFLAVQIRAAGVAAVEDSTSEDDAGGALEIENLIGFLPKNTWQILMRRTLIKER
jgi:hypothetical protein